MVSHGPILGRQVSVSSKLRNQLTLRHSSLNLPLNLDPAVDLPFQRAKWGQAMHNEAHSQAQADRDDSPSG